MRTVSHRPEPIATPVDFKLHHYQARGFIDATGTYFTDQEFSGVWVSDVPLDANEGACGDDLFEITLDVPEAAIADYEWVEEGKPYREWLMPAAVLNSHATLMEVSDAKVQTRDRGPRAAKAEGKTYNYDAVIRMCDG